MYGVILTVCTLSLMTVSMPAAVLEPLPFATVLRDCGALIGEGEEPLEGLFGIDDTTDAVLAGDLPPLGSSVIVLLDDGGPGLQGFVLYRDASGKLLRTNFDAAGDGSWWTWELREIQAMDLDSDGCTDLTIEADYLTGIGPEGSVPFTWTAVLLWDPDQSAFLLQPDFRP